MSSSMPTICGSIQKKLALLLKYARQVSEEFLGLIEKFIHTVATEQQNRALRFFFFFFFFFFFIFLGCFFFFLGGLNTGGGGGCGGGGRSFFPLTCASCFHYNPPLMQRDTVTVERFYTEQFRSLSLKLIAGATGLKRIIREPTVNRPGLALAGFTKYFANKRLQVIGNAECWFLKTISGGRSYSALRESFFMQI